MAYPFLDRFKNGFLPSTLRKAIPVSHKRPLTTVEQFAQLMRSSEFAKVAAARGLETFEEADDFNISDDPIDRTTPYEQDFDLATAAAQHHGVVKSLSQEEIAKSYAIAEQVKKHALQAKQRKAATTPAGTPQPTLKPHDGGSGD